MDHSSTSALDLKANYQALIPRLQPQLLSADCHKKLLSTLAHKRVEDMAVIYRMNLFRGRNQSASLLITESMQEIMDISGEKLFQDVISYAARRHPPVLKRLKDILGLEKVFPEYDPSKPELFAATNPQSRLGASVILYPGFLRHAAEVLGGDYFLLPSSIHEFLLLRDNGSFTPEALRQMVISINHTHVDPAEQLTDSVYRYTEKGDSFRIA